MFTVKEYAEEMGITVQEVLKKCAFLKINASEASDELSEDDVIMLDNAIDIEESVEADEDVYDDIDEIDEKAFEEAANKILKAKRIHILGMRSSFTIAQYLGFYLGIILDSVHVIRMDMGDAFEQVVKINEDDVLISVSFPRYSKKSYQIVSYAKEKGAHIVSLTDSLFAPVAPITDNLLLVKSNMAAFVDSLVPALSVANALIVSVGMKEKVE